eukprot:PhF_6_TR17111/c0_g1_i1/m.26370
MIQQHKKTTVLKQFLTTTGVKTDGETINRAAAGKALVKFKRMLGGKTAQYTFSGGEILYRYDLARDQDVVSFLADRVLTDIQFKGALKFILESKKEGSETACANALAILARAGESMAGTELPFLKAPNSDVRNMCLTAADLRFTNFRRSNFVGVIMHHAFTLGMDSTSADFGTINRSTIESKGALLCVAHARDGTDRVAIGDEFGAATLWPAAMDKPIHIMKHNAAVVSMMFSLDMANLATATSCSDSVAYLWCVENGLLLYRFVGHKARVAMVATCTRSLLVTCGFDGNVYLWSGRPGDGSEPPPSELLSSSTAFAKRSGSVMDGSISPKAKDSRSRSAMSMTTTAKQQKYPAVVSTLRKYFHRGSAPPPPVMDRNYINELAGATNIALALAYNSMRELVAVGTADGIVKVWSARTYQVVCTIDMDRKSVE